MGGHQKDLLGVICEYNETYEYVCYVNVALQNLHVINKYLKYFPQNKEFKGQLQEKTSFKWISN